MRWLIFVLAMATALAGRAQDVVQEFHGTGPTTTGFFTAPDKWEVRWNARQVVSVAVLSSDGTIVAGAAGVLRGSLFVPAGGKYYLKITDGTAPVATSSADASPVGPSTHAPSDTSPASTNAASGAPATNTPVDAAPPESVAWHLQIVTLGGSAPVESLTVFAPYFVMPDAAAAPLAPPPPPPALSPEQLHALVAIKGERAQGIGFLMRAPDGLCVVTSLHLLAANPNVVYTSSSGTPLAVASIRAATERDLAYVSVQGDSSTALAVVADSDPPPAIGDAVLVPNAGPGGEILSTSAGKLIAVAPDRVDFDATVTAASAGAPIIREPGGGVVAMAAQTRRGDLSAEIEAAWPANPAPGAARLFPLYGLRLQGVTAWETLDLSRFIEETSFLRQFHEDTRCLDSFLNVRRKRSHFGDTSEPVPDRYYTHNAKIGAAAEMYRKLSTPDADHNQALDAARELLFDLGAVADTGVAPVNALRSTSSYVRREAQEELAYRAALRKQLDFFSDNIGRFDAVARYR